MTSTRCEHGTNLDKDSSTAGACPVIKAVLLGEFLDLRNRNFDYGLSFPSYTEELL